MDGHVYGEGERARIKILNMKLYIWKHKDTAMSQMNFYPLSLSEEISPNGMYGIAVHAFFKRKEAIKYLKKIGWPKQIQEYYELLTINL